MQAAGSDAILYNDPSKCSALWGIFASRNRAESKDASFPACQSKGCHFWSINTYTGGLCLERNNTVWYCQYCPRAAIVQGMLCSTRITTKFSSKNTSIPDTVLAPLPQILSPCAYPQYCARSLNAHLRWRNTFVFFILHEKTWHHFRLIGKNYNPHNTAAKAATQELHLSFHKGRWVGSGFLIGPWLPTSLEGPLTAITKGNQLKFASSNGTKGFPRGL